MNAVEWVYNKTQRIFDGPSLLLKFAWVALLTVAMVMFFAVIFSLVGFTTWLWHLTAAGTVLSVGGLLIAVLLFGSE